MKIYIIVREKVIGSYAYEEYTTDEFEYCYNQEEFDRFLSNQYIYRDDYIYSVRYNYSKKKEEFEKVYKVYEYEK